MKITYNLNSRNYSYNQDDKLEISKLNFLLTNPKGDFLNLGVNKNCSKFFGFNYCDSKTLQIYKVLDEIVLNGLEVDEIKYLGNKVIRYYSSNLVESNNNQIDANPNFDEKKVFDSFYVGPTGGFIYEIENYEGSLFVDLDIKKQFDFDKWGRDYKVYKKNGVVLVEYIKKTESINSKPYKIYFGIKATNFAYDLLEEWTEKSYSYSKQRNTQFELYIYRLMRINILGSKKIYFGSGLSENEVLSQISLLELHKEELLSFDKNIFEDLTKDREFEKPISSDIDISYKLSNNSVYNFFNKNLDEKLKGGFFAGFPWFSKVWSRDEFVGMRAFINNSEDYLVKERFLFYLENINENTGLIKRINEKDSLESADAIFWFAKRLGDFIFKLDEKKNLNKVFSREELEDIYSKLNFSFSKIVETFWNSEYELLGVKDGDSWMDTIPAKYPLDIQVQFLEFVSFLSELGAILQKIDEIEHFLDFEDGLRKNIRKKYYRNNQLYNEAFSDDIRSNVFLSYYFYPNLFLKKDWEIIFDNSLKVLKTTWGGISSLSKKDSRFLENYSGEKNESYHNGDSWYWSNNICAIVLNDLNEKKYRETIRNILFSSTKDILKMGTIGYGSEISSASAQKAEGCMAQLWSSSTYLEMIDSLFIRK